MDKQLLSKISPRVESIPPSVTLSLYDRIYEMEKRGISVIRLDKGDTEDRPSYVIEATKKALGTETVEMAPTAGMPELKQAIAEKLKNDDGSEVDPKSEVVITPGSKYAAFLAVSCLIDPGDEVLIQDPIFPPLCDMVTLFGGKLVQVPLLERNGFSMDIEALKERITPRSKMIIVNYPNNPTGGTLDTSEVEALLEVAKDGKLFLLGDEIYERAVYDGRQHRHVVSFPGFRENAIMTTGFTKSFGMGPWRLGYAVAPRQLVARMLKVLQNSVTFVSTFVQQAGVAALTSPEAQKYIEKSLRSYQEKRDILMEQLARVDAISVVKPAGSFYMFPRLSVGMPSAALANTLLEEKGVAVLPGIAFGKAWDDHMRLTFTFPTREELIEAGSLIAELMGELNELRPEALPSP